MGGTVTQRRNVKKNNGKGDGEEYDGDSLRKQLEAERANLTISRAPFTTLYQFVMSLVDLVHSSVRFVSHHRGYFSVLAGVVGAITYFMVLPPVGLESTRDVIYSESEYIFWWMVLGVLSSVGLGTGLHTFILFTAPHVIRVALAAQRCNTVDFNDTIVHYFPVMRYADDAFFCDYPDTDDLEDDPGIYAIFRKAQWPVVLWGLGTAIGELPPYFVARAARLAGKRVEELEELEDSDPNQSLLDRLKHRMVSAVQKGGGVAICIFASIPNPLFDLAGLTCGHLLVPFWTFFGATVLGKAVFKSHLQLIGIVIMFNHRVIAYFPMLQNLVEGREKFLVKTCRNPDMYPDLDACTNCCKAMLHTEDETKLAFCVEGCGQEEDEINWFTMVWNTFLGGMILFFLVSIVNSVAQNRMAEQDEEKVLRVVKEKKETTTSKTTKK